MTTHIELRTESPDRTGHFGLYGGRFVPEALVSALEELTDAFHSAQADPQFVAELDRLLRDYAGRPSALTEAPRFAAEAGGARILLKREDLNHTGSHKINNVLGQASAYEAVRKDPSDRGDRRRSARRRYRDRGGAARFGLHGVHG